jgi:hypothetical protein
MVPSYLRQREGKKEVVYPKPELVGKALACLCSRSESCGRQLNAPASGAGKADHCATPLPMAFPN